MHHPDYSTYLQAKATARVQSQGLTPDRQCGHEVVQGSTSANNIAGSLSTVLFTGDEIQDTYIIQHDVLCRDRILGMRPYKHECSTGRKSENEDSQSVVDFAIPKVESQMGPKMKGISDGRNRLVSRALENTSCWW